MGTNYYWHKSASCPTCGHQPEPIHIGKSSFGWTFSFRGYDDIHSLADWIDYWNRHPGGRIEDEYGQPKTTEEFLALVESKRNGISHQRIALRLGLTDEDRRYIAEHPTDWLVSHPADGSADWVDPEGHGFYSGEFS